MTDHPTVKLIREGRFVAEVTVSMIDDDHEWSPRLSASDVRKLDAVRVALRNGDLKAASKLARVFEMTPVAAE